MKMMPVTNNKRKGRLNPNSNKIGKTKFYPPPEKNMSPDGIYRNSKLMYTAASLVGCVVQIQVQNGTVFEGVLRTFSHQLDIVLEMAHKVNSQSCGTSGISSTVSNLIASYPFEGGLFDKLIFKLSDIVLMAASTVDLEYAVKDNFTDTAISKFNGLVKERELEPWEDVDSDSESGTVGFSIEDGTNGWDANDMFRTNAEKYGVQSSYDNTLQDYTVALTKKDTEEYKQQEAKALKIAQEIETNNSYQSRVQLENGDEEDKFSAVIRDDTSSKYVLPQKRRSAFGLKRQQSSKPCIPYSPSLPVLDASVPLSSPNVAAVTVPKAVKCPVADIPSVNETSVECVAENPPPKMLYSTQTLPPRIERRRENEKKYSKHKGRTDEIEEFKKFSSNFKLTDEREGVDSPDCKMVEVLATQIEKTHVADKQDDVVKFSTLNPNAKEFVFNPNAKAFTPRSMSVVTPPVQAMQEPVMMPPQPLFTAPQYVMQAAPITITSPFATTPVPQPPPRFRKGGGHGQALLANSVNPSQLTVQYSSPPGVLHHSAPTQSAVAYPQMNFVVGPRVMSPQPVGVIPTSHSVTYCDTSHLPTHFIMSAPHGASHTAVSTTPHTLQQGQPHSNHHHHHLHHHPPPSPSPGPPPPHSQPHTPMYPPGLQAATGHHSQPVNHPGAFPHPQQLVLMQQQQGHPSLHLLHPQHHLLPQMTLIPTSAATPPYMQHP